jgi:hypothetical protein
MRLNKDIVYDLIRQHISIDSIHLKHRTQVHIAAIMKRGKVMEVAHNMIGSRSKGPGFESRTIHAERAVLRKVGDMSQLRGAVLVVIRIAKGTREVVNSEPCHSCKCHLEKCIKEYGLKHVYYSC